VFGLPDPRPPRYEHAEVRGARPLVGRDPQGPRRGAATAEIPKACTSSAPRLVDYRIDAGCDRDPAPLANGPCVLASSTRRAGRRREKLVRRDATEAACAARGGPSPYLLSDISSSHLHYPTLHHPPLSVSLPAHLFLHSIYLVNVPSLYPHPPPHFPLLSPPSVFGLHSFALSFSPTLHSLFPSIDLLTNSFSCYSSPPLLLCISPFFYTPCLSHPPLLLPSTSSASFYPRLPNSLTLNLLTIPPTSFSLTHTSVFSPHSSPPCPSHYVLLFSYILYYFPLASLPSFPIDDARFPVNSPPIPDLYFTSPVHPAF